MLATGVRLRLRLFLYDTCFDEHARQIGHPISGAAIGTRAGDRPLNVQNFFDGLAAQGICFTLSEFLVLISIELMTIKTEVLIIGGGPRGS